MKQAEHLDRMDLQRNANPWATKSEVAFSEFERALHHLTEAFGRWSVDVHAYVDGTTLMAQDVSVLQVIRVNDRPKSVVDIAKFLNRADSANVLYGLRKLERLGLIDKVSAARRQVAYKLTARGREVCDQYAVIRHDILLNRIAALADPTPMLENVAERMWQLAGFYEQAARDLTVMSGVPKAQVARSGAEAADKPRKSSASRTPARSARR